MIQSYTAPNGKTAYKVRVHTRSNRNSDLRITRQESGIESEERAKRIEATLKKECERELHETEPRGVLFGELVEGWYTHFEKLKVATGQRSKTTHEEYLGGIRKWFHTHWKKSATEINPYVVSAVFESMKQKDLCFGYRKKLKQILTITEIQTLMQKAYESQHEWRRVWAVALLTGMRSGVGGPVGYLPLDGAFLARLPNGMPGIVANALGLNEMPKGNAADSLLKNYSLREQGLFDVANPAPLFVINGTDDPYIPAEETTVFKKYSNFSVWQIKNTTHCGAEKFIRFAPAIIVWLRERLHGPSAATSLMSLAAHAAFPAAPSLP